MKAAIQGTKSQDAKCTRQSWGIDYLKVRPLHYHEIIAEEGARRTGKSSYAMMPTHGLRGKCTKSSRPWRAYILLGSASRLGFPF